MPRRRGTAGPTCRGQTGCSSIIQRLLTSFIFLFSLLLLVQSWDVFFRNANAGAPPGAAYQSPLGLSSAPQLSSLVGAQPNVEKLVEDHLAVQSLIRAYQVRTHRHTRVGWTLLTPPVCRRERLPDVTRHHIAVCRKALVRRRSALKSAGEPSNEPLYNNLHAPHGVAASRLSLSRWFWLNFVQGLIYFG